MTEITEQEAYLVLHKASGIEVGDEVKVVRPFAGLPFGMGATVTDDFGVDGFRVLVRADDTHNTTRDARYIVPFYYLELTKKLARKVGDYGVRALDSSEGGFATGPWRVVIDFLPDEATALKIIDAIKDVEI